MDDSDEILPSKANVQKQLDEIKTFRQTSAYSSFKATITADLNGVRESIILIPPDTEANRSACLQLHGRLLELNRTLTLFEDSQDRLDQLLDQITEKEANEVPDNKQQNE